ncbi:MAG TPA: hypothetical protein VIJ43_00065 [Burkholderiales bacterium]
MAEPEDLLGKADALMARHRPPRTPAEPYAEIPVLDEVVELPPDGDDLPVLTELVLSAPPDGEQIKALAASIRAALLAGLQPEIDALIEERLKESLAPLVERLFDDLRGDLQRIARATLSDAIHAAVEQELDRRKSGG